MKKIFVYGDRAKLRNYDEALAFCGARGIFSGNLEFSKLCDGLLLPGGGDIDPARYGQKNTASSGIDPGRDEAEWELIRLFSETRRPILGICRGHQVINTAFGGELIQNVEHCETHQWEEATGDKVHTVKAPEGSFLYDLYGGEFSVNSAHHQAAGKVAPGFAVAATAEDNTIEALENREKRVFSVQWHPERMAFHKARADTVDGRYIFEFFLNLC